jgi:uncharacterized protein
VTHNEDSTVQVDTPSAELPLAEMPKTETPKKRRGFAAIDPALVRVIAKKGGIAAHARGTAHRFTIEEARIAGQKGGLASRAKNQKPASE